MKENLKKAKAAAAAAKETELQSGSATPADSVSMFGDEVIIKTKEEPKLIEAMKQVRKCRICFREIHTYLNNYSSSN